VLGRYSLFDEIASGGMASVHLGRLLGPAGFARTVAIKRMHPHCARERDFVAMFVDEARLAARVQHPNVVPTLDVVSTGDELFLVMEYVRGESLARLQRAASARGERLPPRVACAIVNGVLQGLHAAHEAKTERGEDLNMVHRDVSAPNVLVGTDGVARVLDFGIAKAAGRIGTTREGQVKGKLAYMSPEQIRGATVNRTVDVYAAGVLLWEALTGARLFAAATDSETLNRVLSLRVRAPSELVPELPRALDAVVLRALERDPDLRFATAREMALALQAAFDLAPASEVEELVERLAAKELASRAALVADVESRSAHSLPAADVVLDAVTPSAARVPRRRAVTMPLLGGALFAALVTVFAVRPRSGVAAPEPTSPSSPTSSSSSSSPPAAHSGVEPAPASSSTPPAFSGVRPPAPAAPPRVSRPHHSGAPGSKSLCDPPWYLDSAGLKKWKPECR
jgi:serine/threonine-protein kinase